MKIYMALDTETSGFIPGQICQLSYVLFDTNTVLKHFNRFYKVKSVEEGANAIHGLTVDKLEELSCGMEFRDSIGEVIEDLVAVDKVFIHNKQFDIKFMSAEFERLGLVFNFSPKSFCTMNHHTDIIKLPSKEGQTSFKWPRLSETLEYYKIPDDVVLNLTKGIFECEETSFHDARYDVAGLYLIVNELMKKQ